MKKQIVFLLFTISCVFCSVIETPRNVVVRVGQRMSFRCRTSNGSKVREWLFTRSNDSSQIKIFANWNNNIRPPPVHSGYGVDVDWFGSGEVYVNETQLENAGRYKCTTEKDGNLVNYEAELIVLVSDPKCNTAAHMEILSIGVKEGSNIEVQCNINYTGNLVPVANWILRSRMMTMSDQRITCVDRNMCYFNATLYWNSSDKEMVFSSEITFEPLSKTLSADSAENIPEYVYKWNFSAVVWYAPKNIWIEPLKTNYKFGDQLRCFVDGNPSPNITWSFVSWTQIDLTDDSILFIDRNTFNASHPYSCRCTAFSFVFDVNISATANFTVGHDNGSIGMNIIVLSLGFVALLLLVAAIALVVARFKVQCCRCSSGSQPDIVQHLDNIRNETPPGNKPENTAARTNSDDEASIEYLDLNEVRDMRSESMPRPTIHHTSIFNQSEYASIDHTLQSPSLAKGY